MPNIRFLKNVVLNVNDQDVQFCFGELYQAKKLVRKVDQDYLDIHLKDGTIIEGVHQSIISPMNTPIFERKEKKSLACDFPTTSVGSAEEKVIFEGEVKSWTP